MSFALAAVLLIVLLLVLAWILWVAIGLRSVAQTAGTVHVAGLEAPVRIVRDDRDIPHIYASTQHDLMFAQGYAEASDRLFQMDLLRRFVYGRLAEILGPAVLSADENARVADIRGIAADQWTHLDAHDRDLVISFTQGVNAAMRREPLPVEFHILLYKPQAWTPQDCLAVGMATALDLIDPWNDVIRRDTVARNRHAAPLLDLYSITDPAYDAPTTGDAIQPVPALPNRAALERAAIVLPRYHGRGPVGSNEWAVGARHSATGRALLANDPHLRLGIPGIWYLVDLHHGAFHAAGGSLVGTPGVVLGHNENIAWGATNGTVATESLYRDSLEGARARKETFRVRFSAMRTYTYYDTKHGFVALRHGRTAISVYWHGTRAPMSPLATFEGLDSARTIPQALKALRAYPGPPQNFVIADRTGAVAYQLAGLIPKDPLWGLRVHGANDPVYPVLGFEALPHVAASRNAVVFTANDRMYGKGYPYRLSPNFAAPYRAHRIEELLRSKPKFTVADFARFQTDTLSIPERDIARATLAAVRRKRADDAALHPYVQALSQWDGRFDPDSRGAPIAWELRQIAVASLAKYNAGSSAKDYQSSAGNADLVLLMRVLRERPRGWWPHSDYDALLVDSLRTAVKTHGTRMLEPWGEYGRFTVRHPLAMLGMSFLDGASFAGNGDSFSVHVQTPTHSQSFRAVWDVGNWDAGGMVIPSGESGEPASGHYTDLSATWQQERLVPLPFSDAAVNASARRTLTLLP
ncbi:MAG TPA: penicillin acylase family protein [Candidatus Baltobacteraceae bacterium]|nr:penicillin acylase family protein [Candidatus Baltobacteraceae bacterium]